MFESLVCSDNDDGISTGPDIANDAEYLQIEFFDPAALKNGQAPCLLAGANLIDRDILGFVDGRSDSRAAGRRKKQVRT